MHNYGTNLEERKLIPFLLAVLAVAGGILTSSVLGLFHIELPWWAPPIDTMTYYGVLYWVFDRYLWRWKFLRSIGLVKIPIFSGTWSGRVIPAENSTAQALAATAEVTITVRQTWQSIAVLASTAQSRSRSISASVVIDAQDTLSYEYQNEPLSSAPATMHVHRGTTRFILVNASTLEGEYYSGRDRQNFGTISVQKVSE